MGNAKRPIQPCALRHHLRSLLIPHGLKIIGDAGNVQIDENYLNLVFIQKGTVSTVATPYNGSATMFAITVSGTSPVLAVNADVYCSVDNISRSGSNVTFNGFVDAPVGTSIEYFLFDYVPSDPGGHGLRVRRGDNTLIYHSAFKPARVVAFLKSPSGSYTIAPGRKLAWLTAIPGINVTRAPIPQSRHMRIAYANGFKAITDGVQTGSAFVSQSGPYPDTSGFTPYNHPTDAVFIDVTGL